MIIHIEKIISKTWYNFVPNSHVLICIIYEKNQNVATILLNHYYFHQATYIEHSHTKIQESSLTGSVTTIVNIT